jgi:hypothetical protein
VKISKNPIKSIQDKIRSASKPNGMKGMKGMSGSKCSCGKKGCNCGKKMSGLFGKKGY